MDAKALSEMGYWVFPTTGRKKFPTKFGGRPWDDYVKSGEHELAHAYLTTTKGTGAIMCLQENDPVALLVLDVDAYGLSIAEVWPRLDPADAMPDGTCIVQTPSGGWHVWFRLPDDVNAMKLPAEFDFGEGVAGEIRVSSKACRLIMLPDSKATNKEGKVGEYKTSVGELNPSALAFPPDTLMARLVARRDQGKKREEKGKPTEAMHFIALLEHFGLVDEGGRNQVAAHVGQVLGRLHPGKGVDPELVAMAWEKLKAKLKGFKEAEFRTAVNSAWRTGSRNGEKFQAREKNPTASDVKAECKAVFGHVPWLVEVFDSNGKLTEYLLGFGGSAKRRHEAERVATLRDVRDTVPVLTRLSGAQMDVVARSPLFVQPGWSRVLNLLLQVDKGVDHLGIPLVERFWEQLTEWTIGAAEDLAFLEAWTHPRPQGNITPFIVYPLGVEGSPTLVIPPLLQEVLVSRLGDLPAARKLKKQYLMEKTLVGMRKGARVWTCLTERMPEDTQAFVQTQYEEFVKKKLERQRKAKERDGTDT